MIKRPEDMSREELEEEVAFLRSELGQQQDDTQIHRLRAAFKLTLAEAKLLLRLYAAGGQIVRHVALEMAVPAVAVRDEDRSGKVISIWISRLRAHLGADCIATSWGRGYALTPVGLTQVETALGGERRAA